MTWYPTHSGDDVTDVLARDFPDRRFKLWQYTVSFSQLLLRSPSSEVNGLPTNIDVAFNGVNFVLLPSILQGMSIDPPERDDLRAVHQAMGLAEGKLPGQLWVIRSGDRPYYVVANRMWVQENTLDLFESPLMWPAPGSLDVDPTTDASAPVVGEDA